MIRFARPEDAPALLEIYRPYVEETSISFETECPSLSEFSRRMETFSQRFPYLVAESQGRLLGYAYAHAFHQRAAFDWTVETTIYVARDARGTGVGTALYRPLLALLRAQGVRMACAVVTIPNEPSTTFHRAMGFQTGGILPDFGYKLGAWHGVAYLYLPLGETSGPPDPVIPVSALSQGQITKALAGE